MTPSQKACICAYSTPITANKCFWTSLQQIMADSNKLKRTDAQMPTTKEFERYPGKKRREEEDGGDDDDDDATAGENPPHAGVGEPPAGEPVTRLGDAFAIAARLAPSAQPTPTLGSPCSCATLTKRSVNPGLAITMKPS